jgi:hypothetical protein
VTSRRIELVVEPLPPEPGVRPDCVETQRYCRLLELPTAPQAFLLRLQDSAGEIHWEPDDVENPWAGAVFAEVLKQLYGGRWWRACLGVRFVGRPEREGPGGGETEEAERDWLLRYMSLHGLSHAFEAEGADPDFPEDELAMDYWWCPRRALRTVFTDTWSQWLVGHVGPWPDRGALKACCRSGGLPAETLGCLLSVCRLSFQGRCEGEELVILSHHVTPREVDDAVRHPSVRRALAKLSQVAVFAEWEPHHEEIGGIAYTVYQKPRPGRRRVGS